MMNAYMQEHVHDTKEQIQAAKSQYNGLIDLIKTIMGNDAFFSFSSERRNKFNGAVYDSIIIPFSYFPKKALIKHADEIRKEINNLKSTNVEYQNAVYVGTNAGAKVRLRIDAVMNILSHILSDDAIHKEKRWFDKNVKEQLFHPGYVCSYCGNLILSIEDCEVDHIIPFDQGGPTDIQNAQLIHKNCNRSKGNKIILPSSFIDDSDENDE